MVLTCTRPLHRPWQLYRGHAALSDNRERLQGKHREKGMGMGQQAAMWHYFQYTEISLLEEQRGHEPRYELYWLRSAP